MCIFVCVCLYNNINAHQKNFRGSNRQARWKNLSLNLIFIDGEVFVIQLSHTIYILSLRSRAIYIITRHCATEIPAQRRFGARARARVFWPTACLLAVWFEMGVYHINSTATVSVPFIYIIRSTYIIFRIIRITIVLQVTLYINWT